MKKGFSILLMISAITTYAQDPEPCCTIIGLNPGNYYVTARNNSTGQLFSFRAEPLDIQYLKLNDAVTTNESFTYVTAINKIRKQYFAGPINLVQAKTDGSSGLVNLNYESPCCVIVNIENAEDCCSRVTAQNRKSGQTIQFTLPRGLGTSLKTGDPIYTETISGMQPYAILQSMYLSNTGVFNAFAYPLDSKSGVADAPLSSGKWIMTPVTDINGEFGRLKTKFPAGVEWGIDVYALPARTLMVNRNPKDNQQGYVMVPGTYDYKLNNVTISNVPIEKGKETRLKAGYLLIKGDSEWKLFDESGATLIIRGDMSKKLALPVGTYQLRRGDQVYPVTIIDGMEISF